MQSNSLDTDWKNAIGGHLLASLCDSNGDYQVGGKLHSYTKGALKAQNKCIDSFHKIFKKETNWLLPALYSIVHDLKTFASKVEDPHSFSYFVRLTLCCEDKVAKSKISKQQ